MFTLNRPRIFKRSNSKRNRRIFSLGQFGDISNGGIYNPGFIKYDNKIIGLVRVEKSYKAYEGDRFTDLPSLYYCELDSNYNILRLQKVKVFGCSDDMRIEDCRLFIHDKHIYVSASTIRPGEKFKQALFILNESVIFLHHRKTFDSPNHRDEKNWGWFSHNNKMYFIYSISPWVIYEYNIHHDTLKIVYNDNFDVKTMVDSMISISSLPIKYGNQFVLFYHNVDQKYQYHQGMLTFSDDVFTPLSFTKEYLYSGSEQGKFPGVLYITSMIEFENHVEIYYGEGNSHTSVITLRKDKLNKIIEESKWLN